MHLCLLVHRKQAEHRRHPCGDRVAHVGAPPVGQRLQRPHCVPHCVRRARLEQLDQRRQGAGAAERVVPRIAAKHRDMPQRTRRMGPHVRPSTTDERHERRHAGGGDERPQSLTFSRRPALDGAVALGAPFPAAVDGTVVDALGNVGERCRCDGLHRGPNSGGGGGGSAAPLAEPDQVGDAAGLHHTRPGEPATRTQPTERLCRVQLR